MSLTHTQVTPRSLAARRANARKSTGPRSAAGKRRVALNALQGSGHQRRLAAGMRELSEKPDEFRRLFADLLASYQPATAAEALLVEDLVSLRWQRRRCERAQAGLLVQHQDDCRQEALRSALERRYRSGSRPARYTGGGLRGAADASYKFEELKELMDEVQMKVEDGNYSEETRGLLRRIYGENPTGRGASVVKLFEDLAGSDPHAPLFEALQQALKVCLMEEDDVVELEEASCKSENVPPARVSYDAWLAPDRPDWRHLLRQQTVLDRQIERKTRLLMAMQRERQSQEDREMERVPERKPSALVSGARPARTDRESPEPAQTLNDSRVPAGTRAEAVPIAAQEPAPQKDCLFLAKQSCDVKETKGYEEEMGVKTKLDSGTNQGPEASNTRADAVGEGDEGP